MASPKTASQLLKLMGLLGEVPGNPNIRKLAEEASGARTVDFIERLKAISAIEAATPAEQAAKQSMLKRVLAALNDVAGDEPTVGFSYSGKKPKNPKIQKLPPGPVEDFGKVKGGKQGEVQPKMPGRYDEDFPGGRWDEESARTQGVNAETQLAKLQKYVDRRNMEIADQLQYLETNREHMHPVHYADMKSKLEMEMRDLQKTVKTMERRAPSTEPMDLENPSTMPDDNELGVTTGRFQSNEEKYGPVIDDGRMPPGRRIDPDERWRPTPMEPNPIDWEQVHRYGRNIAFNAPRWESSEEPNYRPNTPGDYFRTKLLKQAMNIGGKTLEATQYLPEALPYTVAANVIGSAPPPLPGGPQFRPRPRRYQRRMSPGEEF